MVRSRSGTGSVEPHHWRSPGGVTPLFIVGVTQLGEYLLVEPVLSLVEG
jgi:hypothetical protein